MLSNLFLLLPPLPSPSSWPWPSSILPSTNTQSLRFHKNPTTPKLTISSSNNNNNNQGLLQSTCFPSLAWANIYHYKSPKYFNFQINVEHENEPEATLLKRFSAMTRRTRIIDECKRRRFFENPRDKQKRKAREAAQRRQKRKFWANKAKSMRWTKRDEEEEGKKKEKYVSDDDNWELPQGALDPSELSRKDP